MYLGIRCKKNDKKIWGNWKIAKSFTTTDYISTFPPTIGIGVFIFVFLLIFIGIFVSSCNGRPWPWCCRPCFVGCRSAFWTYHSQKLYFVSFFMLFAKRSYVLWQIKEPTCLSTTISRSRRGGSCCYCRNWSLGRRSGWSNWPLGGRIWGLRWSSRGRRPSATLLCEWSLRKRRTCCS